MNTKLRKTLEIALVVLILAGSVLIFVFRNELQNIGSMGYIGLFLVCLLANATVLIPAPSLMFAASCALVLNPFLVALVAALGSTIGEFVGYAFGVAVKNLSPRAQRFMDKLTEKKINQTVAVFILASLPLPFFDIVGVYCGGTRMNVLRFFIACFIGKFVKLLIYTKIFDILDWITSYLGIEVQLFE